MFGDSKRRSVEACLTVSPSPLKKTCKKEERVQTTASWEVGNWKKGKVLFVSFCWVHFFFFFFFLCSQLLQLLLPSFPWLGHSRSVSTEDPFQEITVVDGQHFFPADSLDDIFNGRLRRFDFSALIYVRDCASVSRPLSRI